LALAERPGTNGEGTSPRDPDLASKLDQLFESGRRSRGAQYTYREVAEGIAKLGGARLAAMKIGSGSNLVQGCRWSGV
jgi:hypothetical protein